jgi:hypothetical protein
MLLGMTAEMGDAASPAASLSGSAAPAGAGAPAGICAIPGCMRPVESETTGRGAGREAPRVGPKNKYCQQVDGSGARHDKTLAFRIRKNQVTWPPGTGDINADAEPGPGGVGTGDDRRPVSVARSTLELLLDQLGDVTEQHEQRMAGISGAIRDTVATLADPDAALAEMAAVQREARRRVDAAENERDVALERLRTVQHAAAAAEQARLAAEETTEQALTDLELVTEAAAASDARAAAAETALAEQQTRTAELDAELAARTAERDRLDEALGAATGQIAELTAQLAAAGELAEHRAAELAAAGAAHTALSANRDQLAEQLTAQRRRAETAEAGAARGETELAGARAEHTALTRDRDRLITELAEQRTATTGERRRAEAAEHDLVRATTTAEQTQAQLEQARAALQDAAARAERVDAELAQAREQGATHRVEAASARTALADERRHSQQRLADQRDAYEAQLVALRARRADPRTDRSTDLRADPAVDHPAGQDTATDDLADGPTGGADDARMEGEDR